jgi:hypothetical protein
MAIDNVEHWIIRQELTGKMGAGVQDGCDMALADVDRVCAVPNGVTERPDVGL